MVESAPPLKTNHFPIGFIRSGSSDRPLIYLSAYLRMKAKSDRRSDSDTYDRDHVLVVVVVVCSKPRFCRGGGETVILSGQAVQNIGMVVVVDSAEKAI